MEKREIKLDSTRSDRPVREGTSRGSYCRVLKKSDSSENDDSWLPQFGFSLKMVFICPVLCKYLCRHLRNEYHTKPRSLASLGRNSLILGPPSTWDQLAGACWSHFSLDCHWAHEMSGPPSLPSSCSIHSFTWSARLCTPRPRSPKANAKLQWTGHWPITVTLGNSQTTSQTLGHCKTLLLWSPQSSSFKTQLLYFCYSFHPVVGSLPL